MSSFAFRPFASTLRSNYLLLAVLMLILFVPSRAFAQDYPPYGSNVPTAHFDHGKRAQLTPPPPRVHRPKPSPCCSKACASTTRLSAAQTIRTASSAS
jgi:hypothetical protein